MNAALTVLRREQFAEFFELARGFPPFTWQERLLDHLLEHRAWPHSIAAPTGAGKTSVIDVHVFANALHAAGNGPRVPRRLSLVVNRRLLVDSHSAHAESLAQTLREPPPGVLADVATCLRSVVAGGEPGEPLMTARLRGGVPSSVTWRTEPERCAVLTCTPDTWGSRLLLRGYGTSLRARPQEAGLLAFDNALVVDEAHLSRQLMLTARRVAELTSDSAQLLGVPQLQVVDTTATPDAPPLDGDRISGSVGVVEADLLPGSTLTDRLTRPKPVRLAELAEWPAKPTAAGRAAMAAQVVDEVETILADTRPESGAAGLPHTVGCVLNRVDDAVTVASALQARGLTTALLTGRMRPFDRERLDTQFHGLLTIAGNAQVDVLVATQTVEVGVDIDLAGLVTDVAPGTSLAQRAGRVNRRGRRPQGPVVVLVPSSPLTDDSSTAPYTAADLNAARHWLETLPAGGLQPWTLSQEPHRPPTASRRRDTWQRLAWWDTRVLARTSDRGHAEPDLALWLSDDLDDDLSYPVVFRTLHCPEPAATDEELVDVVRRTPPRDHEIVSLRRPALLSLLTSYLAAGRQWHRPAPILRYRTSDPDSDDVVRSLARPTLGDVTAEPRDLLPELRDGDVIVLDSVLIGEAELARSTWDTVERRSGGPPVVDVHENVVPGSDGAPAGRRGDLRIGHLTPMSGTAFLDVVSRYQRTVDETADDPAQIDALADLAIELETLADEQPLDPGWTAHLRQVAALLRLAPGSAEVYVTPVGDGWLRPEDALRYLVVTDISSRRVPEDVLSVGGRAQVLLDVHQAAVGARAGQSAQLLGVPQALRTALEVAGLQHDDGKADRRFQTERLGNVADESGRIPELLAKSGRRSSRQVLRDLAQGSLPRGWRHEQLSAVHVLTGPTVDRELDVELVGRLVGTSHGCGRPSFLHSAEELLDPASSLDTDMVRELFDVGGWESLVEATEVRYGVWGCAYLEALLRAADVRVSQEGS